MKVALILAAWMPCRLLFLVLWYLAYPVGLPQAWLARQYRASL